jgi:hypothetical protein
MIGCMGFASKYYVQGETQGLEPYLASMRLWIKKLVLPQNECVRGSGLE